MLHHPPFGFLYVVFGALILCCPSATAQDSTPLTARERAMLERIDSMETRLAALEAKLAAVPEVHIPAASQSSNIQTEEGVKAGNLRSAGNDVESLPGWIITGGTSNPVTGGPG